VSRWSSAFTEIDAIPARAIRASWCSTSGIKGPRVADPSIMPTMVSSNINAPSFLIGERCADFLLRDAGDNATPELLRAEAVEA
jgi:choline dehydrogenase-like flavoprotein